MIRPNRADFTPVIDPQSLPPSPLRFRDVATEVGLDFVHYDGQTGQRYIMETMTGGLAVFDYDGDGLDDIYFTNGSHLPGSQRLGKPTNTLYWNLGAWRFVEVGALAGVADPGFGLAVCAADYNNDGFADLYVNNFGPNVLLKNNGDGTFSDVTQQAGVADDSKFGAGCAFLDFDGDGDLDLYSANYVHFEYRFHRIRYVGGVPFSPGPLDFVPEPDTLFANLGDGRFADVSAASGVAASAGTSMGLVSADFDRDGDPDIFVANDEMANFLFLNEGRGRFSEMGVPLGVAFDRSGIPHGSMGVDAGDFDGDGWIDLYVTSYETEHAVLYRNIQGLFFQDVSAQTGAGFGTLNHVTWGNAFGDFDNDGDLDLYVACGHTDDTAVLRNPLSAYQAPNLLLANDDGKFVDVSDSAGEGLAVRGVSRGVALADFDRDGRLDIVVANRHGQPTLLRNETRVPHHWLQIRLMGRKANRNAVGARVEVAAGSLRLVQQVHSGRSYQSHFGLELHFGLSEHERVDSVTVHWPGSRGKTVVTEVPADQELVIFED